MTPAVRMTGVSMRFGAVHALRDVSLTVERGAIHALVGENGAGKTTLMRILYGALAPNAGTIEVDGVPARFRRSSDAIAAGVGMVSQHYSIIPQLNCLENLILGAEPGPLIPMDQTRKRADELAEKMGFRFDWRSEASSLSPAGAQKLEILKLLWRNASIMILDEPTAMLSPADSDALFASLRQLTAAGATIILVTHRLPEVLEHCEDVTVLRGGTNVASAKVVSTTGPQLAEWIVGSSAVELTQHEAPEFPTAGSSGDAALEVVGLHVRGDRGDEALKGVNLEVRPGEVLGIAGVDGSGQRELFQALLGLIHPATGEIRAFGQSWSRRTPRERLAAGVRLIPEDRHQEGVVGAWSLAENAALGCHRLEPFAGGPWVDVRARRDKAAECAKRLDAKHGGLDMAIDHLSGGNQQRFVAGRALCLNPRLILAFQPARGLDIQATQRLYAAIRAECSKGAAALVVSFDLDELLQNCDRIVAMRLGRIYEPRPDQAKDRTTIGKLMVGAE